MSQTLLLQNQKCGVCGGLQQPLDNARQRYGCLNVCYQHIKVENFGEGSPFQTCRKPTKTCHGSYKLPKLVAENNLKEVVEDRGCIYTNEYSYFGCFSLGMIGTVQLPLLGPKLKTQTEFIRDNENRLPLKIATSTIPNAGLGVYATEDLPPNTIICLYVGEMGNSNDITNENFDDSIVSFGYLPRAEIVVCPMEKFNVGRFFNSAKKPNLKFQWAMVERNGRFEPILFGVTCKLVEKDNQIFWDYGKHFVME